MLDQTTIRDAASRLHEAEKSRIQVRQLSLDHPAITIPDAYAIQRERIRVQLAEVRRDGGHKIGLN
jgi:2-oxo-hept-3-ene-1,7-dioate hydratase